MYRSQFEKSENNENKLKADIEAVKAELNPNEKSTPSAGDKLNVKKPTTPKPTTPREKLFAGLDLKSRESKESKDKGEI